MYPQQPQQGFPSPQQYQQPTTQQYAQPQQPVDREIQGTLVNVEVKQSGFYRFHILEQGRQYPLKVDTKKQETIQQAMSLMGQPVAAKIREQQSDKINENSGKPYVNRYLNGIAPAGFAPGVQPNPGAVGPTGQVYQPPTTAAPTPGLAQPQFNPAQPQFNPGAQQQPGINPQTGQSWPTGDGSAPVQQFQPGLQGIEREISIMRQTAAKCVSAAFQILPPEQQNPTGLIEAAEVWVAYFMQGPLRFGVTPFNQPRQPVPMTPTQQSGMQQPQGGGSEYNPAYASQAPQTDIFGVPMHPDGTPIYNDPGREDGDPGPSYT